jgi:3-hydroxyisobutyrate dehydrogenase-like beta-hydroxyacid dehydrogenase
MAVTGVIGIGSISDPVASSLLREGFQVVVTGHVFGVHDGQVVRP